jgi:acetyltransferase-like isoleucine patch superfamily enzyme
VIIEPYVILGLLDRGSKNMSEDLRVGDNVIVGAHSSVHLGVEIATNTVFLDQVTVFGDNVIGEGCRIGPKSVIRHGCRIGNHVRIHSHAFLERVTIGDHVFIAPHAVFADDLHPPCPRYEDCVPKSRIDSYVSIGANVVILPGTEIGHHTQVYSGAVVGGVVEPFSVMAGNPAKRIKDIRELKCKPGFFQKPFAWWDEESVIT